VASTGTASHSAIAKDTRPLVLDIFLILGLLALVACAGLVFLIPWLPALPAGGQALARYAPVVDGDGWLGVLVNTADGAKSFRSQNTRLQANERALASELHLAELNVLHTFLQKPGETSLDDNTFTSRLNALQIIEQDEQTLAADGKIEQTSAVILRSGAGDYQLSAYYPADNRDLVFDPPLLLYPAGFQPGASWQSQGSLGNGIQYRSSGSISAAPAYAGALGSHNDCRQVTLDLEIDQQSQPLSSTRYVDDFCSGVGLVSEQMLDANGKLLSQLQVVSSSRYAGQTAQRTPPEAMPAPAQSGGLANPAAPSDPAGWRLSMIGRVGSNGDTTESTVQPAWAATDPPLLLVAGHDGDLLALDVDQSIGQVRWRYHPSGSIYGRPTFDALHQQIYFGTSAKQLVALDPRGLFRWSFDCGDNIVTQPVVVGDSLVFGSEDRKVYGLDARSGQVLWSYTAGGAVAASPAVDGETVMIASDSGVVYAFDAKTGGKKWVFSTGDAVEAPLVVQDGTLFIASRDNNLYAVAAASGQLTWQTQIGHLLRNRPAVGKEAVYLVDEDGHISAVERATGKLLWTSVERDYLGAPLLVGDTLLAGGDADNLFRLSLDGKRQAAVAGTESAPTVTNSDFRLGLVEGGGAAWAVDTKGYIWRFGPPGSAAQPLELDWSYTMTDSPFRQKPFYGSAVVWNNQFIIADQYGNVYRLDPATGRAGVLGKITPETGNFWVGLVLSGDVLLAASAVNLYAAHLPDMTLMWQFQGSGYSLLPASVEGNSVVWVTNANDGPDKTNQNHLYALDLDTGKPKWQANAPGKSFPGNAIVRKGIVYLDTPLSAYDLTNGKRLWQAAPEVDGDGGAVLSPNGDTIYCGLTDATKRLGQVAAFATADGSLRWAKDLGTDNVSILDGVRLVGDSLIVPLNNGTRGILALDAATGNELWHYMPAEPRFANLAVFPATVWLTLLNGQVVVLNNQSGVELARLGLTQTNLESYDFTQSVQIVGNQVIAPEGWWLLGLKLPEGMQP
jgi:outer membrane protein assembly factor BamB